MIARNASLFGEVHASAAREILPSTGKPVRMSSTVELPSRFKYLIKVVGLGISMPGRLYLKAQRKARLFEQLKARFVARKALRKYYSKICCLNSIGVFRSII